MVYDVLFNSCLLLLPLCVCVCVCVCVFVRVYVCCGNGRGPFFMEWLLVSLLVYQSS